MCSGCCSFLLLLLLLLRLFETRAEHEQPLIFSPGASVSDPNLQAASFFPSFQPREGSGVKLLSEETEREMMEITEWVYARRSRFSPCVDPDVMFLRSGLLMGFDRRPALDSQRDVSVPLFSRSRVFSRLAVVVQQTEWRWMTAFSFPPLSYLLPTSGPVLLNSRCLPFSLVPRQVR